MVFWRCGAVLFFVSAVSCGGSGNGTYIPGGAGAGGAASSGGTSNSGGSSDGGSSVGGDDGSGGTDGGSSGNTGGSSGADGGSAGTPPIGGNGGAGGAPGGPPTVLIVVEAGSTMFEPRPERWDRVYDALLNADTGLLQSYESQMRLGFASFSDGGALGACSQISYVAPAPANATGINAVYSIVQSGASSPSGDALAYIVSTFAATSSEGRKFMLLVLAGDPETCTVSDPDCGQDPAIAAIQQARSQGISTLVLGVGDFVTPQPGFCDLTLRRCGTAHLEDLANAGVGLGVATPPDSYQYSPCVLTPTNLMATYGTAGNAEYYLGATAEDVRAKLDSMFLRVLVNAVP